MRFETAAVHAGRSVDPATGAVTTPIHLSTTFERAQDGSFPHGFEYSRESNPNRRGLEACLAALEGGQDCVAFASGMAAITAAIEALPEGRPRRILLPRDMYFGMRGLLADTDLRTRFEAVVVDMTDLGAVEEAIAQAPPGLVWVETPSNPLVNVVDIAAVAALAHRADALVVADNTWGTPALQRPLALGAHVVLHAVTKYIGGHSDVMLGAAIVPPGSPVLAGLRAAQKYKGAVPSPFECWLALRGVQSLPARMAVHCANALVLARFLAAHPGVEAVHYPGLPSHPGHAVAARQMSAFGGMLSFQVKGGEREAMAVAGRVRIFTRATSLGGTHSLIEHRASVEGSRTMAPPNLLRVSVGLEHVDDLREDLEQALGAARS
jgi:cystathionine gamma-synthase